jgi:methionyl-tRNA formyltransferase
MSDGSGAEPTSVILVTGHTFGIRAFEGIFSSPAFLDGRIEVPLTIGLDDDHAARTVGYQSLAHLATQQGVPHVSTADGRLSSLADRIAAARPAFILVIGWSHLIADDVLSIPAAIAGAGDAGSPGEFGCIGMHPTRLPDGRGQAPIPWTIIKGYDTTALSVFFLESQADTGPVIAQYDLDVHERETAASLFLRIAHAHFTAGYELAQSLGRRQVKSLVQDSATATRWPRRRPRDGEIRATMTRAEIDSLVRALLGPYPRAFISADGRKLNIARVEHSPLASDDRRIPFRCADGVAYLVPAAAATERRG